MADVDAAADEGALPTGDRALVALEGDPGAWVVAPTFVERIVDAARAFIVGGTRSGDVAAPASRVDRPFADVGAGEGVGG